MRAMGKVFVMLGVAMALAGCGGGSAGVDTSPSTIVVTGAATSGDAPVKGIVSVVCTAGFGGASTSSDGSYVVNVVNGRGPCLVGVRQYDGPTLFSVAVGLKSTQTANINQLTNLFVTFLMKADNVANSNPVEWFANQTSQALLVQQVNLEAYAASFIGVVNALAGTSLSGGDFIFRSFQAPANNSPSVDPLSLVNKKIQPIRSSIEAAIENYFRSPTLINLFDNSTAVAGFFYGNSGLVASNPNYAYSDFIAVMPGQRLVASSGMRFTAFFNVSKQLVPGGSNNVVAYIDVPPGVHWIRVTLPSSNLNDFVLYAARSVANAWSGKKWVSYGDSITSQGRWQTSVSVGLNLVWHNDGVGGAKISGEFGDIDAMSQDARLNRLPADSDLITILGGTNDWAQNVPLGDFLSNDSATFYGALNTMTSKIRSRFPNSRIVFLTTTHGELYDYLPRGWRNPHENKLGLTTLDYSLAVRNFATSNDIEVIDIGRDLGWNVANLRDYVVDDGGLLHPNSTGSLQMAHLIINSLWSIPPLQ